MSDATEKQTETRNIDVNGTSIAFELDPTRPNEPAYFVLGVRKSGSTLMAKIVNFLASRTDHRITDWPGMFFRNGLTVKDWMGLDLSSILMPGNVYNGFRSFPGNIMDAEHFKSGKKIVMVRDPRDALVSQYFSDAFSHRLPSKEGINSKGHEAFVKKRNEALETDINDYVLSHANGMNDTIAAYGALQGDPNALFFKYEHVIFQKKWMIGKILKHFDWELHPGKVENLLSQVDVIPDAEDKKQFVRKAIPGDHRLKLEPQTINRLDQRLSKSLEMFDYI